MKSQRSKRLEREAGQMEEPVLVILEIKLTEGLVAVEDMLLHCFLHP